MTTNNERERFGLTGAFLGNILARMGNDDDSDAPNEEPQGDEAAEETSGAESDWYPYDDPAFENDSFEDEEAYLASEEYGEGDGLEGMEGLGLGV